MAMNKMGQVAIVAVMIGVAAFMLSMIFINPLKEVIIESRSSTQLDCSNSSITDGSKATCLLVDLLLPVFISVCFGLGVGAITAKYFG